jgi:hypothetical protein
VIDQLAAWLALALSLAALAAVVLYAHGWLR